MDGQRLRDDVERRHAGVQGAKRILKNVLNAPAQVEQCGFAGFEHILLAAFGAQEHPALVRRERSHDNFRSGRLAAAAFPHQSQAFAGGDGEGQVTHRVNAMIRLAEQAITAGLEGLGDVFDTQDRRRTTKRWARL